MRSDAQGLVAILAAVRADEYDVAFEVAREMGHELAIIGLAGLLLGMVETFTPTDGITDVDDALRQLGRRAAVAPEDWAE